MRLITLTLALAVTTSHAEGLPEGLTASSLLENCTSYLELMETSSGSVEKAGNCSNYLLGATDAMNVGGNGRVCLPAGLSPTTTARTVVSYIQQFPASEHSHRYVVLFNALEREYPCKAL